MLTIRFPSCGGGGGRGLPKPPDADPFPPGCRPPGHVTCDACWGAIPPSVDRTTDMCKNITLPQTSFAGGKNSLLMFTNLQYTIVPVLWC